MASTSQVWWRYGDAFQYLERVGKLPPVIICCAVNGGIQGKESCPALPESADEIADSVHGAYRAGASMVHVHARERRAPTRAATQGRDVAGGPSARFRERCPDIIINDTTGAGPDTLRWRSVCNASRRAPRSHSLNLTPDTRQVQTQRRGERQLARMRIMPRSYTTSACRSIPSGLAVRGRDEVATASGPRWRRTGTGGVGSSANPTPPHWSSRRTPRGSSWATINRVFRRSTMFFSLPVFPDQNTLVV